MTAADLNRAERNARDFIIFADGMEEAGMVRFAQRSRIIARETLELVAELRILRGALHKAREERDRLFAMKGFAT